MPRSPRRRHSRELPRPSIESVLKELGADDVPAGHGWIRMRCYAHEDRTPSAAVNHEVDGYRCHSCGRQGDALKLLQNELGLSFSDTCERARQLSGEPTGSKNRTVRTRRPSDLLKGPN